jgi:hypothetical protein
MCKGEERVPVFSQTVWSGTSEGYSWIKNIPENLSPGLENNHILSASKRARNAIVMLFQ